MGWIFSAEWQTAAELRKELDTLSNGYELVKSRWGSDWNLYQAIRAHDRTVFAVVTLIKKSEGWFGYKSMGEDAGPYDACCPDSVLDELSDTMNEYAVAWRERCRTHCEGRRARTRVTETI